VSPSSLIVAAFEAMGFAPLLAKSDLGDAAMAAWCRGLHGALVEATHTDRLMRAVDIDISSAYPGVFGELGGPALMRAERLVERDVTDFFRLLLADPHLADRLRDARFWRALGFTRCVVRPRGELFPVEIRDPDPRQPRGRLVVRPCYGERLDVTGPDVIAATSGVGGVPVDLLEAHQVVSVGEQAGLRQVRVFGELLDPYGDPLGQLAALRQRLKRRGRSEDLRRAAVLRVADNAGAYGNFARFDADRPGPWCFPPIAATVTAACRAILMVAEYELTDAGFRVLAMDTDGVLVGVGT
jgi:hypothetical protein